MESLRTLMSEHGVPDIKVAVLDTYVPPKSGMPAEGRKYYRAIDLFSKTVIGTPPTVRSRPNQHGSLVTYALTRPLMNADVTCIEVLDKEGRGSFKNFMDGLVVALNDVEADIVHASLGFPDLSDSQQLELEAVSDAFRKRGVILNAAAGNSGLNPYTGHQNTNSVVYPAALDQWLACGSSQDGRKSPFSSIGDQVLWTLDGEDEEGVDWKGDKVRWSGTSLSSPKLAGICGRMEQEIKSLPIQIHDRQEWVLGMLPFWCKRKYQDISDYRWLNRDNRLGFGSLEHIYKRMCKDFDRFKDAFDV